VERLRFEAIPMQPYRYQAAGYGAWTNVEGGYFWQAYADTPSGVRHLGPVVSFSLVSNPKPPPPNEGELSLFGARRLVWAMILRETGAKPARLGSACAQRSLRSTRCRLNWRTTRWHYSGSVAVSEVSGNPPIAAYSFHGHRRVRSSRCQGSSRPPCKRPVRWTMGRVQT